MSKPVFDLPDVGGADPDRPPADDGAMRARFSDGGGAPVKPALKVRPQTSPLLSSTPPTVARALTKAYPYLVIVNHFLAVATWTNDDPWVNVTAVLAYTLAVLYFEQIVVWSGHLVLVAVIAGYAALNSSIAAAVGTEPTLDEVVQQLTSACIKSDMLLAPMTSLRLTVSDIKRLVFTTVFLTPLYLVVAALFIKPRIILLVTGVYILTYHSATMRVFRRLLWRFKATRVVVFWMTGLDFNSPRNRQLLHAAMAKVHRYTPDAGGKPVRFTYVIYENQRKWLGIGWTHNLLTYERAPWTDEFLNESASTDDFKLPEPTDDTPYTSAIAHAKWRWVDKTWRLDLTNDGAIQLPAAKRSKTTANPAPDEGFVYTDNTWKSPATTDTFSKYTRRRRWIRTAELCFEPDNSAATTSAVDSSATEVKSRKSLRFVEETETVEVVEEDVDEVDDTVDETVDEKA
ncbi:hypothetical protein DIURU_003979 [Diutina rugosa]|uniref:Peroxin/Ferlin domain-containing protein n=1 Tax=Diutina rugosa TaxID=5481 RepID=A0A642UJF0_DIURU|nr:uncharacterized protein DIURU_003979 [Diutina rugosa]KAA8900163.1 hypothetical protein DIURU_003979 [Diutina rugosa]